MGLIPVRKCYQLVKIALLVIMVVTILAMFEQWRGGKRSAGAMYLDPVEGEYERQIQEDEARIVPGLGDGGVAAKLIGNEKLLGEESEKKLAINVYLSDRIAYNRTLKDFRNPACKRMVYDAELPSASVILIFHNEPYSVVVRTLWSVVNSVRRSQPWFKNANFVDRQTGRTTNIGYPNQDPESPFVYVKEIILVDDNSTLPELKGKLSHYIRTRLPPDLIRIMRLPERVGLMRARLTGSRAARGDVLVFLDAHCEVEVDWLRPLLQRVREKRDAVVTPVIDTIEASDFKLSCSEGSFQVGGFNFNGHFTWTDVPDREKKRRGSDIAATWSPTMAGGLFAMSRNYFFELGGYDEQMGGWGGENLEMSFRIWQCGGTLETIPCSRVGHVFRSFHPYGLPAYSDTHGINTARMAEVWMDEYAELFYLHRPDLRNNPKIGDVTHRKILREKLRCKNFQWYLDNIYKEKFVPVRDVYGYGRFRNADSNLCLDTFQREGEGVALGVYPCHADLQATQYFSLSFRGELRDETSCASVLLPRSSIEDRGPLISRPVVMSSCHGKGREQKWRRLPSGQLQHVATKLCLDSGTEMGEVKATPCRTTGMGSQIWDIDYNEDNDFHSTRDLGGGVEREMRLKSLRGQHRISRSLMSYSDMNADRIDNRIEDDRNDIDTAKRRTRKSKRHKKRNRKHSKSKKRTKNKFLLKLIRTLMNGTEDHLEVDIHCKHKQLYPNNTFVRDLVTILNDNNVKIINNGRVFERNKVSELSAHKVLHKLDIPPAAPSTLPPLPPLPPVVPQMYKNEDILQKIQNPVVEVASVITQEPVRNIQIASDPILQPESNTVMKARPQESKKIIIEDFVEINSLPTNPPNKRIRKHRRKPHKVSLRHRSNMASTSLPIQAPRYKSSAKDSADVQSRERDSDEDIRGDDIQSREDWHIGESRFHRRHNHLPVETDSRSSERAATGDTTRGAPDPADYSQDEQLSSFQPGYQGNSSAAPVKVVMRSNLTFNLGDEFFNWRSKATDDLVNDFLGELTIPSNNITHNTQSRVIRHDHHAQNDDERGEKGEGGDKGEKGDKKADGSDTTRSVREESESDSSSESDSNES